MSMPALTVPSFAAIAVSRQRQAKSSSVQSSQGGEPAQPEPGQELTAEEEALLYWVRPYQYRRWTDSSSSNTEGRCLSPSHEVTGNVVCVSAVMWSRVPNTT